MRHGLMALVGLLAATPVAAAHNAPTPESAVAGAGWSAVPVAGNSGQQIYRRYCFECHGDGPDRPGTAALQVKYGGLEPARLDQRTDLNAPLVIYIVRHGISVMPSIRKTEISDADLKAIADYLAGKKD
jgi:mono/diheme cytochrome c family protein